MKLTDLTAHQQAKITIDGLCLFVGRQNEVYIWTSFDAVSMRAIASDVCLDLDETTQQLTAYGVQHDDDRWQPLQLKEGRYLS